MTENGVKGLVSVVVPVYNGEKQIQTTLESVFSQTYRPIEVIVVDDGSVDSTRDVISQKFPKVIYFYKNNSGVSATRNFGIKQARGEYLAFLDADDLWDPEKISKQVNWMENNQDIGWCYCDCLYFRGSPDNVVYKLSSVSLPQSGDVYEALFIHNFISSPTLLFRRQVIMESGLFKEKICLGEDWDLWLRIAENNPIGYIDEALAFYRQYSLTSNVGEAGVWKYTKGNLRILIASAKRCPEKLVPFRRRARSNVYYKCGLAFIREGAQKEGRRMILKSLKLYFSFLRYVFLLITWFPQVTIEKIVRIRLLFVKIKGMFIWKTPKMKDIRRNDRFSNYTFF